jgi:murein DD-endopeptidase MepM/ murein hydrolase activator NlpD
VTDRMKLIYPMADPRSFLETPYDKGPNSQNSNLISFGLEGLSNPGPHELILSHNTLINEKGSGNFINLKDQTNKLVLLNNIFGGTGKSYNGVVTNVLDQGNLVNISRNYFLFNNQSLSDYHLTIQSPALNYSKIDFRNYPDWKPEWEFDLNQKVKARKMEFWPDAGAFEYHELNAFQNPVQGVYGKDYIIINHVDHSVSGIRDLQCLDKTYEGHQGTDYALSGFEQMEKLVDVFSVDSGVVTAVRDGLFDQETVADTAKKLGNYLVIQHGKNWHSYYAHLKKNSLLVKPGDKVRPGQKIASVGCSGNCSDPHLHFELWYDSTQVVDPYDGPCGNQFDFWADPIPYDSSFHVWKSGLIPGEAMLDSLRFKQYHQNKFNLTRDLLLSYWNLQYGVRKGDVLSVEWLDQNGVEKFQFDYVADKNYWYQYFWTYMTTSGLGSCDACRCRYLRNGQLVEEFTFSIDGHVRTQDRQEEFIFRVIGSKVFNVSGVGQPLQVINLMGQIVMSVQIDAGSSKDLSGLTPGYYILTGGFPSDKKAVLKMFIP